MTSLLHISILALLLLPILINAEKKVVCYYGSWARYRPGNGAFTPANIDPSLCSHIIFGFACLEQDNKIAIFDPSDEKVYKDFVGLKRQNSNLKAIIAIGGWNEGSEKYSRMASNPSSRATFVQSVLEFLPRHGFDGLDLDWEYPAARGGRPEDKQNFVSLVRELKAAFSGKGYELTAAVGASASTVSSAYDIPQLSNLLDAIHVMTYDFHGTWESKTGLNAPLNEVDAAVKNFLNHGALSSKLILGMGTYGHSWTLSGGGNTGIGAPTSGAGKAGPYTRQDGTLGYNEICENIRNWKVVNDANGVYAHSGNQWVGYDDVASIKKKVNLVSKYNLGGGMIWSLETDDFLGVCNGGKYPLLRAINAGLSHGGGSGPNEPKPKPPPQCLPHDSPCRGNHGDQSNCCQGLYCHKPNPDWAEGRCYNRG